MKKERLLTAIGQIDDDFIAEAKPEVITQNKSVKHRWFALLAACVIFAIFISIVTPLSL